MCLRASLVACLYHFLGIFTRVLTPVSQKSALISINSHLLNTCSAPSPALYPQNPILSWVLLVTSWLGPAAPSLGRPLVSSAGLPCDWALDIGLMDRKKEEERDTCCLTGKVSASLQASGKHQCLQGDMPPVQLQRVWIPEPRYLDAGTQMPPAPILFFPNQGFNPVTLGSLTFCLLSFNSKVISDSLRPHGLQHTRLPWPALSCTISWSLLNLMSIESVMSSNHLILCHPLLLLPSIFPSIRVLSNESALRIRWPKYWSFSSASVLPMDIQGWFPLGLTGLSSLLTKGLSRDSHLELSYSYN